MKSLSIYHIRSIIALVFVVFLFVGAQLSNQNFLETPKVGAAGGNSVLGYAWSENIGWVSFNSINDTNPPVVYGVNVDPTSGNFSGYAWSENIGWIWFGPTGVYPNAPLHSARLEGGKVKGWARVCAGAVNSDCTGAGRAGGWDGWIKLSDVNVPAYGVTFNATTGNFGSFAWGSDVVGWIDFAPVSAGTNIVRLETVTYNITASSGVGGSISPSGAVSVTRGSNRTFTIIPNPGYVISNVIVDGVTQGTLTLYTFSNIQRNHTIAALFIPPDQEIPIPVNTCGDSVCSLPETLLTCPEDCRGRVQQF